MHIKKIAYEQWIL